MRKVVVTGGAGFIGSHLADELAVQGYRVVIVDDLSTGTLENIEGARRLGSVDFVRGSVTDLPLLESVFEDAHYVFHLAAIARVNQGIEDPTSTNVVNVTGTLNVLLAARSRKVGKVVYTSSSAVYGDAMGLPQSEEMPPHPVSPYAVSKLAGEYYCGVFREVYGMPTVCLRYFNAFGPRQDPYSQYSNVIPIFIGRLSRNLPPIIYGDGEQSRDFVFIRDVVRANILAAENGVEGVFNVGNGRGTTINELARLLGRQMGKDIAPIHEEPRAGDPEHTLADTSKARSFGFEAEYDLEQGLQETLRAYPVA